MEASAHHINTDETVTAAHGLGEPALAIVVVTYNSADVLSGLLDSMAAGLDGISSFELIVVDNDSHDSSVDIASSHPIGARILAMGRNAGYAAAINAAARTIAKDVPLLVLNPDIRLTRGSIMRLCHALNDPSVGVVVPQILHEDGKVCKSARYEPSVLATWSEAFVGGRIAARLGLGEMVDTPHLYQHGGTIEWASGAALLISADARHVVGDWDESFFLYSEEVDYFRRLRMSGLRAVYVPLARVVHIGGDYRRNKFLSALLTTNRIGYFARHHGTLESLFFRIGIVAGEILRAPLSSAHRASLKAALSHK
jgi:N-acetylglucosaminyl-diphospho-decaprenol L-rhamnosyltransferase